MSLLLICGAALFVFRPVKAQQGAAYSQLARVAGEFDAKNFNSWSGVVYSGFTATGAQTMQIFQGGGESLGDGTVFYPYAINAPLLVDAGQTNQEVVTPTAVSGCTSYSQTEPPPCSITATFANTHGRGAVIKSGTAGAQEAINYANTQGGGSVQIDGIFNRTANSIVGVTGAPATYSAFMTALAPFWNVALVDKSTGVTRYWTPTPTGLALAVPTTLTGQTACDSTHQFCSDATVAGSASYAGGALHGCVAYVDIMGNEGPCSLDSTFTDVSAKAIDVAAPAASPGAIGYVVYLSLDAGTYAQAYQIPPASTNCTLTAANLAPTPVCAVANTTYGQAVSTFGKAGLFTSGGSQITTIALNTGQHFTKLASTVQTTVSLTPMTNSSVTYSYAPSSRVGAPGISSWNATQEIAAGGISASSTTGIPMSMGTWTIPANYFNYIGAEFRVSGKLRETPSGASDTLAVIVAWDSALTNTTTVPTSLCNITNIHTEAAAQQTAWYSCTVRILTTGTGGTALVNGSGLFDIATGAAGVLIGGANDTAVAASGAINLTVPARIAVRFVNTGSTVTNAQPLEGTLEVLN
jgi:hypothetical protein